MTTTHDAQDWLDDADNFGAEDSVEVSLAGRFHATDMVLTGAQLRVMFTALAQSAETTEEILHLAAVTLWHIEIPLKPFQRSLSGDEMRTLHGVLVAAGQIDPEPEFATTEETK